MADLLFRLERAGELLGEWRLGDPPLTMTLRDPKNGKVVAVLTASVPEKVASQSKEESTLTSSVISQLLAEAARQQVDAVDEEDTVERNRALFDERTMELPSGPVPTAPVSTADPQETEEMPPVQSNLLDELPRIDPDRLDVSTTQDAPSLLDEPTASLPELPLDTGSLPELSLESGPISTPIGDRGIDEVPMVSGSGDLGPLVRHPGDDFTLPLPEHTHTITATEDYTGELTGDVAEVGDSLTADLIEVEGRAEVWSRRKGEWVLKGSLVPGQRARMKEGSVKCLDGGGLLASPGPHMRGTADLPNGDQIQMMPDESPHRFPAGTSVTLWNGDKALYVRSDQPVAEVPPVEYHSGRRAAVASYEPPRSDLEATGPGEI